MLYKQQMYSIEQQIWIPNVLQGLHEQFLAISGHQMPSWTCLAIPCWIMWMYDSAP